MIEWIIFLGVWFVGTEIIYFGWMREDVCDLTDFLGAKVLSIWFSLIITSIFVGVPMLLADSIGLEAYYWSYGFILFIVIFFAINWGITQFLDNRKAK